MHPSIEKETFVDSVPKEFIGIAVKVSGTIHKWCNMEVSEIIHYGEENE